MHAKTMNSGPAMKCRSFQVEAALARDHTEIDLLKDAPASKSRSQDISRSYSENSACASVQDRSRDAQCMRRTRVDHGDIELALPGMDRNTGFGTPHRRTARSPHPPCPHPGDEWRQLPSHLKPLQTRVLNSTQGPASGARASSARRTQSVRRYRNAYLFCATAAYFCSADEMNGEVP
jgi:hypothetical protein